MVWQVFQFPFFFFGLLLTFLNFKWQNNTVLNLFEEITFFGSCLLKIRVSTWNSQVPLRKKFKND